MKSTVAAWWPPRKHLLLIAALVFIVPATAVGADRAATPEGRHWAWQPPVRPKLPDVRDRDWLKNSIDAFILAKLEAAGLTPAPVAGREQLIRRASFDLIGLPPTPEEIDAFVTRPLARRLGEGDRPAAGLARTTASGGAGTGSTWPATPRRNGYEFDEARPDAWRYRDYVIRSRSTPTSRTTASSREQLAGDELFPDDPRRPGRHRLQPARPGHDRRRPTRRSGGRTRSTT